jgi:hypothetical protein
MPAQAGIEEVEPQRRGARGGGVLGVPSATSAVNLDSRFRGNDATRERVGPPDLNPKPRQGKMDGGEVKIPIL